MLQWQKASKDKDLWLEFFSQWVWELVTFGEEWQSSMTIIYVPKESLRMGGTLQRRYTSVDSRPPACNPDKSLFWWIEQTCIIPLTLTLARPSHLLVAFLHCVLTIRVSSLQGRRKFKASNFSIREKLQPFERVGEQVINNKDITCRLHPRTIF